MCRLWTECGICVGAGCLGGDAQCVHRQSLQLRQSGIELLQDQDCLRSG